VTANAIQLKPLRSMPVKERVTRRLVELIESGTLGPGEKLPGERDLSEQLQVSRGTVREAVQFVQALGLVEIRHGAGTFVRSSTAPSELQAEWRQWTVRHAARVHDLLEVRKALEPFAAELAAARIEGEQLSAMAEALREMESAVERSDTTALVQADVAFHHAFCEAAGNAALLELADAMGQQLLRERGAVFGLPKRPARSLVEHRKIYDAIRAGDGRRARQSVIAHLASVERDVSNSLARGAAKRSEASAG
jgi:GntR family transcriptional regulator, transcriptional repressor for pyruvate dehydrogenase complex